MNIKSATKFALICTYSTRPEHFELTPKYPEWKCHSKDSLGNGYPSHNSNRSTLNTMAQEYMGSV
uniref:Uncharacterized protein n=1 Tax=Anguilla anguilla TaxID=7936 RepID=A0A0E9X345_ANGAN